MKDVAGCIIRQYRVEKQNLQVERPIGFEDFNEIMVQNSSPIMKKQPICIDSKQKNLGQAHSHVGICKKAQEVQIALRPLKNRKSRGHI